MRRRKTFTGRVLRVIKPELKLATVHDLAQYVSSSLVTIDLCNPSQGASQTQRVGEMITPVNIHGHLSFYTAPDYALTAPIKVTWAIIRYLPSSANTPVATDLLAYDTDPFSTWKVTRLRDFTVLRRRSFYLSETPGIAGANKRFRFYIRLRRTIRWDTGGYKHGGLLLIMLSDIGSGDNPPICHYETLVRYRDN